MDPNSPPFGPPQLPTVRPTVPPIVRPTVPHTVRPTVPPIVRPTDPPTVHPTVPHTAPPPVPPTDPPTVPTSGPVSTAPPYPYFYPYPPYWYQYPPLSAPVPTSQPEPRFSAHSFASHPHQQETLRPSFFDNSQIPTLDTTLQRETSTCNLLRRYDVAFSGQQKEDVEEFLEKLQDFQDSMKIDDAEVLRLVPVILSGSARYWARPLFRSWANVRDFAEALRLQYGVPDFQNRLSEEIHSRSQGPDEPIASFISSMRHLMDKRVPKLSARAQLDKIYKNLHPDFSDVIEREDFHSFEELQGLCRKQEIKRERRRAYRLPPPAERALFPDLAYKPLRKTRAAAIEAVEPESGYSFEAEEPLAAIQQPLVAPRKSQQPRSGPVKPPVVKPGPIRPASQTQTQRVGNPSRTSPPKFSTPPMKSIAIQTSEEQEQIVATEGMARAPPSNQACWVCKLEGHWAKECPSKNGVVCFRCNYPGVTTPRCPNCNPQLREGNGRRGN